MDDSRVPHVAARQAGVFTRRQAVQDGWSQRQVSRRLASGRWRRLLGRGLVGPSMHEGALQFAWAAWLTRPDAAVGHTSAALVRGWPVPLTGDSGPPDPADEAPPLPVHLTGRGRGLRAPRGVRLHELHLPAEEVGRLGGLLVTTPTRTAVDCLMTLPPRDGRNLYALLLSRDLFSHEHLGTALRAATGRPGVRRLLALFTMSHGDAASPAEFLLHQLLREHGLTGWTANAPILGGSRIIARADDRVV